MPKTGARMQEVRPDALAELMKDTGKLRDAAGAGATDVELSDLFGVEESALVRHFEPLLREARASLVLRVRRLLLQKAEQGQVEALAVLVGMYLTDLSKTGNRRTRLRLGREGDQSPGVP